MQGRVAAAEEYTSKIDKLNTKIDAADEVAKLQVKRQNEVTNAIETQNEVATTRIRDFYKRMLHTTGQVSTCAIADHSSGVDAASDESGAAQPSFEQRCVLDANTVVLLQEWVRANGFPVVN
jgi:hypothetical protein